MGKELDDLDDVLTLIDNIEEGVQKETIPYEDILIKLRAVDTVENQVKSALSGVRSYQYLDYQMNQMSSFDVDRFCGNLFKNQVHIELFEDEKSKYPEKDVEDTNKTKEIPFKRRSRKKRSRRRLKKSAFAYKGNYHANQFVKPGNILQIVVDSFHIPGRNACILGIEVEGMGLYSSSVH